MRIPTHYIDTSSWRDMTHQLSGTSNSGTTGTSTVKGSDSYNFSNSNYGNVLVGYSSRTTSSSSGSPAGSGSWEISATMSGGSPYRLTDASVSDPDWEVSSYSSSGSQAYATVIYYGSEGDPSPPRVTFSYDYAPYLYDNSTLLFYDNTLLANSGIQNEDDAQITSKSVSGEYVSGGGLSWSISLGSLGANSQVISYSADINYFPSGNTVSMSINYGCTVNYNYSYTETTYNNPPYTDTVTYTIPYTNIRNVSVSGVSSSVSSYSLTSGSSSRNVSVRVTTYGSNQSFTITISYERYASSGYYVWDVRLNGSTPRSRQVIKVNGTSYTASYVP